MSCRRSERVMNREKEKMGRLERGMREKRVRQDQRES